MPALFIDVKVEPQAARDPALAKKLAEACPVDIFEAGPSGVRIVERNLDECVLCDLCVQAAPPGAVRIVKLYEQEASR
jgi:NAD-dependent dihydropyrimidine dehydrogenase PreA subunit